MGAHILKVVLDFDRLVSRGKSHHSAVVELVMKMEEVKAIVQLITVRDLYAGMILDEDIRAKTGLLVMAKGHEVTYAMMERLRSSAKRVPLVEPFRVLIPRQHVAK